MEDRGRREGGWEYRGRHDSGWEDWARDDSGWEDRSSSRGRFKKMLTEDS